MKQVLKSLRQQLFPLLDKIRQELSVQDEQGFVLKNREECVRLSYAEIEFAEVINKKVFFHLTNGAIREVTAALADLEGELLNRPEFIPGRLPGNTFRYPGSATVRFKRPV